MGEIICDGTDTDKVHEFGDTEVAKHHYELDVKKTEAKVRGWIRGFAHLAHKETLTDYVRAALGHLVLDEIWDKYGDKPLIVVLRKAISLFKARGYHQKRYV